MAIQHVCLICYREIPHEGAACPHCRARVSSTVGATPQMLVGLFVVIVLFFVGTGLLTGAFRREREHRAQEHLELARTLTDAGEYGRSVEQYRKSLTYRPDDRESRLGLAQALYLLERYSEAEAHLIELRAAHPTLAPVNYLLARINVHAERRDEAVGYYRAAVYGQWSVDPAENRVRTRFELIELLESEGDNFQAVGELVELWKEAPDDRGVRHRIGRHFLDAGSPTHAIEVFGELSEQDPRDGEAFAGLGEAEFSIAHYYSARTAFQTALRLRPDDAAVRQRLRVCDEIRALDPTYRPFGQSLGARERLRRSRELVERVLALIEKCIDQNPEPDFVGPPLPDPDPLKPLLSEARAVRDGTVRGGTQRRRANDTHVDANISLAERLWSSRAVACGDRDHADEALLSVLRKLAS